MSLPLVSRSRQRSGLKRQFPEPARFWIAHGPTTWRGADEPWTDLAGGCLQGLAKASAAAPDLPGIDATDLEDVFFLPPVAAALREARDRWAAELIESGTPVLLGLLPGETLTVRGAMAVYDLLLPLLAGDLERLASLPGGATAVWPLISGLTDTAERWEEGCRILAQASVRCLQPLSVELAPADRRHLAELGGEGTFDALFHGQLPSELELSRCAARHGLEVFSQRPAVAASPRQNRNRDLATALALAGETWLRLGHSVSGGQALIRGARGAETTRRDLTALARESNLGVLDWLDTTSRKLIEELAASGRSSLLESLQADYRSGTDES